MEKISSSLFSETIKGYYSLANCVSPSVPSRKVWIISWLLYNLGIEMLELDPRLVAGETPVYGAFGDVTLGFPRTHFPREGFTLGDAPLQTLASQHRELYLSHVQP